MLDYVWPGTITGGIATAVYAALKYGPRAFVIISRERTRKWLIRRATKSKSAAERKRASDLLDRLEPTAKAVDG